MHEATLKDGEPHPMAYNAKDWLARHLTMERAVILQESLASSALSGNESAAIMLSTLERLLNAQPVSDRYLLGLAWFVREGLDES